MGKDEKHLAENLKQENIPAQKPEPQTISLKKSAEKKEDKNYYWRSNNAETPKGNASSESKLKTRDEDNNKLKDEVSKVTVTQEEVQENQNELESLAKEKEKEI